MLAPSDRPDREVDPMKLRRLLGRDGPDDADGSGPAGAPDGDDVARAVGDPAEVDGDVADGATPPTTSSADEPGSTAEADGDGAEGGEATMAGSDAESADTDEGAPDDAPAAGGEDEGDGEEDGPGQMAFELADWGARERKLLDDQLGALGVPRAWEASTLVVDMSNTDVVDDLIDEIEERTALDLAPDVEPVTYEVGDWPDGLEDRFIEALIEARVPHQRGYREIAIGVDDEEQVDALIETLTAAWEDEQPTEEELDGPDAQQVLSELFVTADRLLHDAGDAPAIVRFDDAATSMGEMALPFGFGESDWDDVAARVVALREMLSEAGSTDEQISEAARDLRTRLRPLV